MASSPSICVGATVCHRQHPSLAVLQVHVVKDLIRELPIWCPIDALATLPCPCRLRENLETSLSAVLFKLHTGNEGHSSDVYMHTCEEYWLLCKALGKGDMRRAARPVGSPPCIMNLQRQQHKVTPSTWCILILQHLAKAAVLQTLQEKWVWLNGVVRPCMAFVSITMVQLKALYEGSPSNVSVKDGIVIVSACAQC